MSVIPGHGAAGGDQVAKAMAALDKAPPTPDAPAAEVIPPAPAAPNPNDQANRAFQVLAKKEKQMLMRARETKAREQALAQREAIIQRHEQLEAEGKKNPMAILGALGWDYDKLTQYHLAGGQMTPEMLANQALQQTKELQQKMQDQETKRAEEELARTKAQQDELAQGFKDEIADTISSNLEEFEFINLFGMQDLVYETIRENFNKNKKIMDIKEAAKLVEQYLEEEEAERFTKSKKFQSKLGVKADPAKEQTEVQKSGSASPTLNNKQTVSTTSTTLPARTEQDRIQRALAALDRK